jgi:FlaA1/EpsC-like NDP-sugar epimerase
MMPARPGLRTALAIAHDVLAAAMAWTLAYALRFNFELPEKYIEQLFATLPWVVPLQAAVFLAFGLYRGIWRYASLADLRRIALAVAVATAAVALALALLAPPLPVPRSVLVLDPLLLVLLMGGSRFAYRSWKDHRLGLVSGDATPVFVLGAGDAAAMLVRELERGRQWRVAGLFDDAPDRRGRSIHGVPVLGGLDDVPRRAAERAVGHAIIAMPAEHHRVRRRAADLAAAAGLKLFTVPSFDDLLGGRVTVSQLRHVELDDLLGRDPVTLDTAGLSGWLRHRVVLVTGAGGSIGSELCRQVARFGPRTLVLYDACEFALYRIEQEFRERRLETRLVAIAGDVRDGARVARVLRAQRPSIVLHAAAYKHVPLMENDNCAEAVANNAGGTLVLARCCVEAGVETFVLVSTDKAVNPVNVMGASKRLAELVCQALQKNAGTRFVSVRFGNVLGSSGSVIPRFREQIAAGGPVTVTHPEITRYFMSIPEAAQLVLQAALMGRGGEIFVLDMGEPVRIVDLARAMIRLSGCAEDEIRIEYTGLRPGEKLYEEVLAGDEHALPTPHPKLRIARARPAPAGLIADLERWLGTLAEASDDEVRAGLARRVEEYRPPGAVDAVPPATHSAAA